MIVERYGYVECGLDGEKFQDLIKQDDQVYNEEYGEWQDVFIWDQDASCKRLTDHWYEVHDKDQDGVLDE